MNIYAMMNLLTLICVALLSFFVIVKKPASRINQIYFLYGLSIFVWCSGSFLMHLCHDRYLAVIAARVMLSGPYFIALTGYHFSAVFTDSKPDKKLIPFLYVIGLFFLYICNYTGLCITDMYKYPWGFYPKLTIWSQLTGVMYYIFSIRSIYVLYKNLKPYKHSSSLLRNRTKYVLAAMIVSTISGVDYLPSLGINIYPPAHLLTILMLSIIAYAIVRHQLLDIEVVIKKTLIFAVIFIAAYAVLALFTLLMQSGLENFLSAHKITVVSSLQPGSWPSIALFGLNINVFSIPPFIVSFIVLFIGIFIYLKNKTRRQNAVFLLMAATVFVWLFSYSVMFSYRDEKTALIFSRLGYTGVIFIPVILYHLVLSALKIYNAKRYLIFYYAIGLLFSLAILFTNSFVSKLRAFFWGYYPIVGFTHVFFIIFFTFLYGKSLIILYKYIRTKSFDFQERNKARYLLLSFLIALFGSVDFIPNYGIVLYPFGYIFIFVWMGITAYAIVRHQLMDIEIVVKKTIIFTGLFMVVYAVFAFFAMLGQVFFERFVTQNRWAAMVPSMLVVTIMLRPLENFLVGITDKYLFQKKYDYRELLRTFTTEVLTVLNMDKLIRLTEEKLAEIMKLEYCRIEIASSRQKSSGTRNDEKERPCNDEESSALRLPITMKNKKIGALFLGRKKSDRDYDQEDMDILQPLANTLGIAISNAKLFDELSRTRAETAQKEKMATIGTLAAGMAHEIRNPITTIRNFADYLPDRYNDKEFVGKFEKLIPGEIDRIERIARSLLEFSSAEDTEKREEFPLDEPIRTVISLLGPQCRTSEIKIICDAGETHLIRCNRAQLQDALFNILNYITVESKKGSSVVIECAIGEDGISLFIRNKDLFVAEHIIKDVFEPVSGQYKERRGFGFNLFVAKQLLERIGAELRITSDEISGSEFKIGFMNVSGRPS